MPLLAPLPSDSRLARHRQLAPSASIRVSPLCLGALNFGGRDAILGECSKETAFEMLDYFYHQGGNFIDTANAYQEEQSEVWIGEWISSRQNRDEMVIATKFTVNFKRAHKDLILSNYGGNGAKSLRLSVEQSLKKLQTSYIDILYVHYWDYTVSVPELMHSLNDVVASGKVLYLGISDAPAWVVSKANQYARDHGLRPFVVYQGRWNAGLRDFERDIIPMCRDEGMGLAPYGVLGMGHFQTEAAFKEREENKEGRAVWAVTDRERQVSKVLEKMGNARDAHLTSIALAYVMHKAPYVFPIVGGRKVEHITSNHAALGIVLSEDEMQEIEAAYDFDAGFPHSFLSGSLLTNNSTPRGAYEPADVILTKWSGNIDWVESSKPIKPAELKSAGRFLY